MPVTFDRVDLDFILRQIEMAEAGQPPVSPHLAFGLRQLQGTNNNTSTGLGGDASTFGSADQSMPLFAPDDQIFTAQYIPGTQFVFDSQPRTISNLIADQTASNPAAVQAFMAANGLSSLVVQDPTTGLYSADPLAVDINGVLLVTNVDPVTGAFDINPLAGTLSIPNVTPDGGISAPFSTWFTLFGQFFDHGLDLITKSAAGPQQELIFITLNPDDPLFVPGGPNFMIVARAEDAPGASTPTNLVTPFVDQNQTYTSHPSHQVFLREYTGGGVDGVITGPVASTGELLNHLLFNADGSPKLDANGNQEHTLATWGDVKANALKLGIILNDHDVGNVPLLATDAYGNLILGPHGLAQIVVDITQVDGLGITHHTQHLIEGTAAGISLTAPPLPLDIDLALGDVTAEATLRIGHAFINDMAQTAAPFDDFGNPLVADGNGVIGGPQPAGTYDGELLDQHFVAGDGRVNENIGLTTVHQIFENEHNRLVDVIRDQVQKGLDAGDTSFALGWVKSAANLTLTADDLAAGRTVHLLTDADFNGERLFQAAKFGTETQYQHLVFEEFARKVVPTIHVAGDTNIHLDPAITSEFANAVYRFGHSMLDESIQVQNVNPDGSPMVDAQGNPVFTQEGLIQAFTNPLDFLKYGASGIAQGATNQVGNEIDEFVTGALRNNLLGLPLDLAAINIARGRDTGIPTLNAFRNEIYQQTHDANLRPYMNWDDFRLYLKHDASIVNFVAAYGNYDDILNATTDAAKRQVALELVTGTHINSATGANDSFDFMHSTGIYANVADPTAVNNQTDPRLLHEVQLDPVTHQPVIDTATGLPVMEVAPWSTGSVTGLDNVDMWIGGLAEKQALNGSLLGSTFELIFRVQLESLQDADRLYYLPRIEGTHFSDQIENNTFADMIQTDLPGTHHVPAAIFMTMEYNIEAKDFYQTNLDGTFALDPSGNPQWDLSKIDTWNTTHPAAPGAPALLEVTAKSELHFNGEDYFFGNTMVLGGTDENDKLLAGNADDDTVWGDGGNDTIDGGGGNDNLFGGKGDDFISDQAGVNVAHGDEGNDTILMGKGADVVFGGDGNDLIVAGGGDDEVLGGTGNDIIFGGEGADEMEGDQGDDWIDGRGMNVDPKFGGQEGGDSIFGDVGAPTGQLPLYDGNDVLLGGVGTVMKGFGGDDIMLGVGGFTKFYGGTGFDWASFELETQGVSADMQRREFVSPLNPIDGDGFRTVFTHVEGISGSQFGDDLIGENSDKVARLLAKDELYNFNLLHGLIDLNFGTPDAPIFTRTVNGTIEGNFFAQGTQTFAGGDIMLGGGGSDRLEGGGGADIIDGDAFLHVDLTRDANGNIFAGSEIIREIRYADRTAADANAVDTAIYNDNAGNYTLTVQVSDGHGGFGPTIALALDAATVAGLADGSIRLATDPQGFATLSHLTGAAVLVPAAAPLRVDDGTDLLRNIERLEFADLTVDISGGRNHAPGGALTIDDPNPRDPTGVPAVGDTLTAVSTLTDADFAGGVITNPITYQWQYQDLVRGDWINVTGAESIGAPADFVPSDFFQGVAIRLKATYTDPHGYQEAVFSDPLAAGVVLIADPAKNTGPTAQQRVVDFVGSTTAYQGEDVDIFIPVQNKFVDDHTASTALTYKAEIIDAAGLAHDITGSGATFNGLHFTVQTDVTGAVIGANITGTLPANLNGPITVRMSVSDDGDFPQRPADVPITVLTTTTDFKINVVNATGPAPATETAPAPLAADPSQGMGVHFDRVDLDYILTQIKMAEANQPPISALLAFGLRTVSGEDNSAVGGQGTFGESDQPFPRLTTPVLGIAQDDQFAPGINLTSYAQTHGFVFDSTPRLISNLIADQSTANPAALEAATSQSTVMPAVQDPNKVPAFDGIDPTTGLPNFSIANVTPDGGISAPFNTWFTLFGQFFDHGLDFVNKGGNGEVIIPLLPDDPLYQANSPTNFMVLTRGTLIDRTAGADGIVGTSDDQFHESTNAITPPVDQSQTYSSHPSHQVFLREYVLGADNQIHSTGRMLDHVSPDGSHHMPTWGDVKQNAIANLGLKLSDYDVVSVPLVVADEYGNLVRGSHGFAQVVYQVLITDNVTHITTAVERTIEGVAGGLDIDHIPVPGDIVQDANHTYTTQYLGAGAAFINDMAHNASPFNDFGVALAADGDTDVGNTIIPDAQGQNPVYDNELLDSHFVAGDGRVNENIGLTAIHDVFHSEHNRLVAQTEALVQQLLDNGDTSFVKEWVLPGVDVTTLTAADIAAGRTTHLITPDEWNGERIFQVARFGTETQYQHLVFEEFARKIAPDIHLSGDTNVHLDPAVFAEFAHTVYRFGHSMLDENLQRFSIHQGPAGDPLNGTPELDANGNPILLDADGNQVSTDIALLTAFTNPLAYLDAGKDAAGQLALGSTAQVGNEIDEFVTGTLRNNLLGLPLDLAALNIARGRSEGVPTLNMVRNELFSQTGDHVLKPYDSWHEFGQFLKHPASLINFVAAYGTGITGTTAERRADATAIVAAGENDASHGDTTDTITLHTGVIITVSDAWDFMHSAGAWANIPLDANYVNDLRAVHSVEIDPNTGSPVTDATGNPLLDPTPPTYSTGSITGLDQVDFWIGGLAEKQNLHDSMLGSTFDFVFKLQMENLQDGDRLYYLPRIEGTHFSDQIEENTFAAMVMNATGTHHLSASIFLTPEYQIEADSFYLHNPDGSLQTDANGNAVIDPTASLPAFTGADGALHPLIEIQQDGTIHFLGEDNFFGNTMVLGGTDANDRLMAGQADDDTVWGDGGNDTIDGGGGNDNLFGGDGNDVLTNENSSIGTVFHGDAGNDTIIGSKGDDAITGGDGNDVIYGGQGVDDIVGGTGNDIIYGGEGAEEIQGDQGDDWIDGGPDGGDVLFGDVGAPTGGFPLYAGNDVLIGGVGTVMKGFSGDDIMLGVGGFTKFDGGLGFDWASFEHETQSVEIDMARREFIADQNPAGGDGFRDIYQLTEGASGSMFDDVIKGDNKTRVVVARNTLDNPTLIKGLADVAGEAPTTVNGTTEGNFFFAGLPTGAVFVDPVSAKAAGDFGGNILLGGAGGDSISGGSGDDILDGDAYLHVELLPNAKGEIGSDSEILREIRYSTNPTDLDVAVFSANWADYTITAADSLGFITVTETPGAVPPGGNQGGVGGAFDGTDRIRNFERVQFADFMFTIDKIGNLYDSTGTLFAIAQGNVDGLGDFNFPLTPDAVFPALPNAVPNVFDPFAALTVGVATPGVNVDGTPEVGKAVTLQVSNGVVTDIGAAALADITDLDFPANPLDPASLAGIIPTAAFKFQWQYLDIKLGDWVTIADPHDTNPLLPSNGATSISFTPGDFFLGQQLRVIVSYTDPLGHTETIISQPTPGLLDVTRATAGDGSGFAPGTAIDPITLAASNTGPEVLLNTAHNGFDNTTAQQDKPIQGMFLPLVETFNDSETAPVQLGYKAEIIDANGVAHLIGGSAPGAPGTALAGAQSFMGLTFTVDTIANAAGGLDVADGHFTGTPTSADGSPAFTGAIHVRITATDEGTPALGGGFVAGTGLAVTNEFDINILPSGAPVITSDGGGTSASLSVPENTTAVTTVTAVDPNPTDVLTFSIAGGADAARFAINATTGALSFITAPNFEAPTDAGANNIYDVIVQASDGSLIDTQAIAVTVTNVNEAPVITSNGAGATAAISVAENSTAVTTVTATDPDAGASVSFSLAGGADASKFTINATTGALSFLTAPDFEAPTDVGGNNVYDVLVQASDGSLIDTQAIAVTITNVAGLTLTGTAAANTLTGGSEEDIISGLGGADSLSGLGGNDTITGGTGNDIINAGAGNDVILYTIGDGADTVIGDLGLDTLTITGTAAADTLTVAFDGTALTGIAGGTLSGVEIVTADLLGGSDTLSYGTSTAGVTVDLATTSASGFTSITGIENVTGGAGADTLIGDGLANALTGGTGDDMLIGGLGVDTLTGGAGTDTVSYVGETDALVISLATGTMQRGSAAAAVEDVLVTLENVIGGTGSDSITGSTGNNLLDGGTGIGNDSIDGGSGNDTLLGGDGHDQLFGGVGADSIDGGTGNDIIVGGAGNDTLLGGDGNDSFSYAFGDGVDSYSGGTGADALSITGTAGNDALSVVFNGTSIASFTGGTITSIESITADLAGGTDTLNYAGTTVDVSVNLTTHTASGFDSLLGVENVTGGAGNDTLTGDAAANILAGGAGNDTYFVGAGDTVTEGAAAGTDTVNSSVDFTLGANVENLNLTAAAGINGTGNALANVITDTAGGNNVLSGLGGDDTITGGAGNDTMTGGTGNDMFVFHTGFGNDVITDFDANPTGGQDLLDLSAYAPDITAGNFADHVSIAVSAGNTVITIDGSQHITLTGVTGVGANIITSQDFIL